MYRCLDCGKEFSEPVLKQKSYLKIFILTVKAQWDRTLDRDSIYVKHCPFCDAPENRLKQYIDPNEYDEAQESAPGDGEDIGERKNNGLHV